MSSKIFLAVVTCVPLVLAGCSNSSGVTTSGTPASSTASPGGNTGGSPTPPVRVLGLDVIHIERTDLYNIEGTSQTGIITTSGNIVDYDEGRYEMVCPGVPPRGNECTVSQVIIDGTRHNTSATFDFGVSRSIGWLTNRDSWTPPSPKAGINFFQVFGVSVNSHLGGIGTHSMFWTASGYVWLGSTARPANYHPRQMHSVAMGELHDGRPDYTGPNEPTGTATWRGAMVGTELSSGTRLFGDSAIVYDFADNNVDVAISGISPSGIDQHTDGSYSGPSSFSWTDLRVNNDASFYIPGYGNDKAGTGLHPTYGYIDGDFYGPNAEETAGVFERQGVTGAWLAIRESDGE